MAKYIFLIFIFLTTTSSAAKLEIGDVLLQPLSCWSCSLIEEQENSEFAHVAVVAKIDSNGEVYIAEALGEVRYLPLDVFLNRTKKGKQVKVMRPNNFFHKVAFQKSIDSYIGNPYDKAFRWNNYEGEKESLYCSELLFKTFIEFIPLKNTQPQRMPFDINPELWDRYFKGQTPRGELGVSPENFNNDLDFTFIKYL